MTTWSSGYVADIGYTFGYYGELNPLRIHHAFANNGLLAPHQFGTACELGFGQGLSANVHAAASMCEWHGTDFNPEQASFAQELSAVSGARANLREEAFDEFCTRSDLPDFDFIGVHGIWSWISDHNRSVIVDFVRRKLKAGGVLYVSYNTLPGWAAFAPMRHLLTEHARRLAAPGHGILSRIDGALEFADKLLTLHPGYAKSNPQVSDRITRIKEMNRHYLAHEFFNRDWHPMHFATMAQWLESAKLQYACSASFLDHVDAINLTADQRALLEKIPDPVFRESTRDFITNQQFRRDYWVKGARKLGALEQSEATRQIRVLLTTPAGDVPMKVTAALGEVSLNETVYSALIDRLSDHQVHVVGELEKQLAGALSPGQLNQALVILNGMGHVQQAQSEAQIDSVRAAVDRLNLHLLHRARGSNDISYLASPVTGGGITVGRVPQLFLLALKEGHRLPADWTTYTWRMLGGQGQKLVKDGSVLVSEADNVAELTRQAQDFSAKTLPILKALGIA
jgi:SAM-dependent methyltransferase